MYEQFKKECEHEIEVQGKNKQFVDISREWLKISDDLKYTYHFECYGRPVIQYPMDIQKINELIWDEKPDFIIETGIAHGGSIINSAAQLKLLDSAYPLENGQPRKVYAIDIEIREHNRLAIDNHPFRSSIELFEGSSIDPTIISKIKNYIEMTNGHYNGMVLLDSDHSHNHVLNELALFKDFVGLGQYMIAFDTSIVFQTDRNTIGRNWDKIQNPLSAVREFIENNIEFEIQEKVDAQLMISEAYNGYLRRISR